MPAQCAMAIRCIVWFVLPPVANKPTVAFTMAFSSTIEASEM